MFAEWEKNAHECHLKWVHGQEFKKQNDQRHQGLYQALGVKQRSGGHPNQGRRTTSQGGNTMDIDAMRGPELSDKQKVELMANSVMVGSPCLSVDRVLGFLRGVVPE